MSDDAQTPEEPAAGGRKTEPNAIATEDVPAACIDAARHVANCPRCYAALSGFVAEAVARLHEAMTKH